MGGRDARNITALKFFTGVGDISSPRLEIAHFQRNYVWAKKHILSLIESVNENDNRYYIGNIIIQRCKSGATGKDYIVDGQQRLVTLSLIIKALSKEINDPNLKKRCKKFLYYHESSPRIIFSRRNLNKMYKGILNDKILGEKDDSQKLLHDSYVCVTNKIKSLSEKENFIKKIFDLEFVTIKCPSDHDVHQLFESLNSKGKKLSAVQLTKNTLLANTSQSELSKINGIWERIEKSFELNKSKIIWFDKFLRHQWFSIGGYVNQSALFDKTRKHIKEIGPKMYSIDLEHDSILYLALRNGEIDKLKLRGMMAEAQFRKISFLLPKIPLLNLDQIYAVLLSLIKYAKKDTNYCSRGSFANDIEKLWCFLILLRYSNKINPSSYEKIFADFCYDLFHRNLVSVKQIRIIFFKKLAKIIPNKSDFIKIINTKIVCTGQADKHVGFDGDRDVIRTLLLYYLENGQKMASGDNETIEHIIPKGSLDKWSNIGNKFLDKIHDQRYKLGNLTILKNDDCGNEAFNVKFRKTYTKSSYQKNKELNKYQLAFNSKNPNTAIMKRGKEIAESIYDHCYSILLK